MFRHEVSFRWARASRHGVRRPLVFPHQAGRHHGLQLQRELPLRRRVVQRSNDHRCQRSEGGFNAGGDVAFYFTRQLEVGATVQIARTTVERPGGRQCDARGQGGWRPGRWWPASAVLITTRLSSSCLAARKPCAAVAAERLLHEPPTNAVRHIFNRPQEDQGQGNRDLSTSHNSLSS
jgi:hypothetical protein